MRVDPWRCQLCGMGLVFFRRWGLLGMGGNRGFCCHQRRALPGWAYGSELARRSAVGAEASASSFLIDALPFSLFLGCREVHGGRAEVGGVAGDVGGR